MHQLQRWEKLQFLNYLTMAFTKFPVIEG
jgi:hypothetical protein